MGDKDVNAKTYDEKLRLRDFVGPEIKRHINIKKSEGISNFI
mgnify:CR=1 FL=1